VDLGGYLLSDSIATPDKFVIPAGTVIPAHGYLLVWADKETTQLNWTSAPGLRYRLLYKNDLNDQAWSDVGQEFTATSTDMSLLLEAPPGVGSRFFRLVLVQP
jgi:hypothetical protein